MDIRFESNCLTLLLSSLKKGFIFCKEANQAIRYEVHGFADKRGRGL